VRSTSIFLICLVLSSLACGEEPAPTFPPTIDQVDVSCDGTEYGVVLEVSARVEDADRDLLTETVKGWVNGLARQTFHVER
jgi:hypothetical protein